MADFSNNPFIDHTASVASRFPNINAVSSPSPPTPSALQYSSWPQQQQQQQQQPQQPSYQSSGYLASNPTGYPQQSFQQQQQQWPQQQQPQQSQSPYQAQPQSPYSPPTGYQSPTQPSSLGHQFAGQVNPLATGYPQGQMQAQAQYAGYPTQQAYGYQQQQPQQSGYGYPSQQQQQQHLLAQFDPYANLGQLSSPSTGTSSIPGTFANGAVAGAMASPTQAQQQQQQPPQGMQHPRAFIHSHKAELEAWDPPTWRQVQSSFDALKVAWETRKRAAEAQVRALGGTVGAAPASTGFFGGGGGDGYGGYGTYAGAYQTPQAQEVDRLNALIKEADSNIDTVAAGALQMAEVFGGYRHSGDIASKRRVRESCNAALMGLPEYPPPTL